MKKIFDIKKGHYVVLNEDDSTSSQQTASGTEQANAAAQAAEKTREQNADTQEKIGKLDIELSNITKNYQSATGSRTQKYGEEITAQRDLMAAANEAVANSTDAASRSKAMQEVLAIRKKIADIEYKKVEDSTKADLEYAKQQQRIEYAKIQVLSDANAATVAERWNRLPQKYRNVLNESNIHQAKIYMKNLVDATDEDHIIKDMRDFKRIFKDSNLVYGKDKNDFFVLCIDEDDFNKLYSALQEAGYLRDEIFAVVMPQILDRSTILNPSVVN